MYLCLLMLCISFNFEFDKVLKQPKQESILPLRSCVYPSILNSIKF